MNKYLIVLIALVFAFSACEETPEASLITTVAPFSITDAPSVIMTDEKDAETITVNFTLSAAQVVETAVAVTVDVENSTAVEDEDFTLSTHIVDIEAYKQGGSFDITIISDILPEPQDPDIAKITIGPADQSVTNWSVDNSVTFELQIYNDTTGSSELAIITDWDGLLAVPSITGNTDPVFPICGNGVDMDPVIYGDAGNTYFTYSDDYAACPELFSNVQDYPDDTFYMFVENFANPFAGYSDALGDFCMDVTIARPGISFVAFTQESSLCYIATDAGYSQGGPYELRPLMIMVKSGGTITIINPTNDNIYGVVTRIMQNPDNIARWQNNMEQKPFVQPSELERL